MNLQMLRERSQQIVVEKKSFTKRIKFRNRKICQKNFWWIHFDRESELLKIFGKVGAREEKQEIRLQRQRKEGEFSGK